MANKEGLAVWTKQTKRLGIPSWPWFGGLAQRSNVVDLFVTILYPFRSKLIIRFTFHKWG